MPNAFNFSASPFDCLTPEERQLVRQSVNVGYYPAGAVLLAPHMPPTHLFILIKGHVVQWDGEERVSTYGPDDCFDGRALLAGKVSDRFVAAEEVVTYELRQQAVTAPRLRLKLQAEAAFLGESARTADEICCTSALHFELQLCQWQSCITRDYRSIIDSEFNVGPAMSEHSGSALEAGFE